MERQEVYKAIDAERAAQDKVWRTGRPDEVQYDFAASHILLIGENAEKLRSMWYTSDGDETLKDRLIKIAAITVRALEEVYES